MKNKIIFVLILLIGIVGCSTENGNTNKQGEDKIVSTCKMGNSNVNTNWSFFTKDGIYVSKSIQKTVLGLEMIDEIGMDVIEKQISDYKKEYDAKGISYKAEISSDSMTEILTIDYELADINKLVELGFITLDKNGDRNIPKIKKTIEIFEYQGCKCKMID